MKKLGIIFLIAIAVLAGGSSLLAHADEADRSYPGGMTVIPELDGVSLKSYENFEKDWNLVTVRFRKDTGELRFTYANPVAWQHMLARLSGKTNAPYPNGAVFAKTGIATEEDKSFPSSAVPGGARRFQLMIRDTKKYVGTDGWGYALFNEEGKTFPGDPKLAAQACAACHRLVPERDYVFSVPMSGLVPKSTLSSITVSKNWSFRDSETDALPKAVAQHLPVGTRSVRILEGEMIKHVFEGTLDEVRPLLSKEAHRSKKPALLLSQDGNRFSLVFSKTRGPTSVPDGKKTCASGESLFLAVAGLVREAGESRVIQFCYKGE